MVIPAKSMRGKTAESADEPSDQLDSVVANQSLPMKKAAPMKAMKGLAPMRGMKGPIRVMKGAPAKKPAAVDDSEDDDDDGGGDDEDDGVDQHEADKEDAPKRVLKKPAAAHAGKKKPQVASSESEAEEKTKQAPISKKPAARVRLSALAKKRPSAAESEAEKKKRRKDELDAMTLDELDKLYVKYDIEGDKSSVLLAKQKEDLESKKNPELKESCGANNLKVGGPRDELIERLLEHAKDKLARQMVGAVVEHEGKAAELEHKHKERVVAVSDGIRKELGALGVLGLKEAVTQAGLKGAKGKKEDMVEALLSHKQAQGEIDKVVAGIEREEEHARLLALDKDELVKLCNKKGVDPIMKEVVVERLINARTGSSFVFAAESIQKQKVTRCST